MNKKTGVTDYVGIRKGCCGYSIGELELQIMNIIWDLEPPVTAPQVFKIMYPRRELAYCTILQTMTKLAEKDFLTMERSGPKRHDPFQFTPTISRQELGLSMLEEISNRVLGKPLSHLTELIQS
jgi:predicted transcriptional regulator